MEGGNSFETPCMYFAKKQKKTAKSLGIWFVKEARCCHVVSDFIHYGTQGSASLGDGPFMEDQLFNFLFGVGFFMERYLQTFLLKVGMALLRS